jgi:hypothetical protein
MMTKAPGRAADDGDRCLESPPDRQAAVAPPPGGRHQDDEDDRDGEHRDRDRD